MRYGTAQYILTPTWTKTFVGKTCATSTRLGSNIVSVSLYIQYKSLEEIVDMLKIYEYIIIAVVSVGLVEAFAMTFG